MLRAVGCPNVESLFDSIPDSVRLHGGLDLPDGLSEMEVDARMRGLAGANVAATSLVSFAGAGCYDHYIPAVVDHILRKPEFFTAYTPYQPEVSQGTLQSIYEFQTMVCELTGMDVANASMYDGATAFVEAGLMAARVTRRHRVVVSAAVHPEWRQVLATYAAAGVLEVVTVPTAAGVTDASALTAVLDDSVAALMLASPTFYGTLEDLASMCAAARAVGALAIVAIAPALSAVLEPPSVHGADIVVAEGQPLGNPMSFGGPGIGLFAARDMHLRQMPGRIVGRTVDADGTPAFVLTMQTREQHIRREKATSNICSNHALNALAASVYLSATGVAGLEGVGRACVAKAHYLRERLLATGRFEAPWDTPFAHEFALVSKIHATKLQGSLLGAGYLAGVRAADISGFEPSDLPDIDRTDDLLVFAVTEKRTRAEMDAFVQEVASL